MSIKKYILLLFAGTFVLNACQKDIDVFIPDPGQTNGPDTSWHLTVTANMPVNELKNSLAEAPYLDSFQVNAATATVLTPSGLVITFPPFACANGTGQPITGKVNVEVLLVKNKGNMIRLNKPSTYNDSLLVTAGQIFITLWQNGQLVQLAPNIKINVRYADLPINQQMSFFTGDESNTAHFNWMPDSDPVNNKVLPGSQAYEIYTNRLRWISASHTYNMNNTAAVKIKANIASYFTNANTIAFAVFKDFRSVVELKPDLNMRSFVSGNLPVGKNITIVVISKQGNDYYLGHETTTTQTVTTSPLMQSVQVVPVKKQLPEILSYLATL